MVRTVARAIELGVTYFDTARSYGDGQSETQLGSVLHELGTDVIVGTKVRLTGADMEMKTSPRLWSGFPALSNWSRRLSTEIRAFAGRGDSTY